ncbi:hypothetical protein [Brevibacillus sp. AY1]|uniref:hypothetical protein n=1 Tax=Brevibacillus sp. AY1 TaxID=2807621 RepID=UPI00245717A2|nr:hypothetical protein [Brevibacillus sp. AY1]MDH4620106.1 hypothetical protein [Brevibacillus sp. AY1]
MTLLWIVILIVFTLIGIFKNRKGEFLKQSALTLMVVSNLLAICIVYIDVNKGGATHVGWIDVKNLALYFLICIHGVIAGLLIYLFSSARR